MKNYRLMKFVQMCILISIAAIVVIPVFVSQDLYHMVAENAYVRVISFGIWAIFAMSFIFLFYDFSAIKRIRREYDEMDRAMYSDPLTGIGNRSSCDAFIEEYLERELPFNVGCVTFDINNIIDINKAFGPKRGNELIRSFSTILSTQAKGKCFVGRNGGNKFLAIFRETNQLELDAFVADLMRSVEKWNEISEDATISVAAGIAINTPEHPMLINELVALSHNLAVKQNEKN